MLKGFHDFTLFFKIVLEVIRTVTLLIQRIFQILDLPLERLDLSLPSLISHVVDVVDKVQPGHVNSLAYDPFRKLNSVLFIRCHEVCSICAARGVASSVVDSSVSCGADMPTCHLPFRVPFGLKYVCGVHFGCCRHCLRQQHPSIGDDIHVCVIGGIHLFKDGGGSLL